MTLPQFITIRYNDTSFECDTIQVGFRSRYLKNQILKSLIPIIEIRGIWEIEDFHLFLIEFCQNGKTDFINTSNALKFRAIAADYEADQLLEATTQFFNQISPHEELRELINCIQIYNSNPSTYEDAVSNHLSSILLNESDFELILTIPITSIFRILSGKHEEEIDITLIAKLVIRLIEKYGKSASTFLKFVRIPNLPSPLLIEFRELFRKYGIGSIEDCETILNFRNEIDEKNRKIDELIKIVNEKNAIINEKNKEIEEKDQKAIETQKDLASFKVSIKPSSDLLNLYLKTISIIPDIPFSFVFKSQDGIDQAMTVTNIRHFGVGYALTASPYNPKDPNQLFYFRQSKKNTIESVGHPGQMLDDNYGADYNDGTILYVHPPNGFSNQQWNYIDHRIITVRTQNAVTFINGLNPHPFRLYPVDDAKLQRFSIRYFCDDETCVDN